MKPTIQLRLGQHLTMTPQLQQAIKLLQLSTLDLKQEIQEALDSNLMLETEEEGARRDADAKADVTATIRLTGPPEALVVDGTADLNRAEIQLLSFVEAPVEEEPFSGES